MTVQGSDHHRRVPVAGLHHAVEVLEREGPTVVIHDEEFSGMLEKAADGARLDPQTEETLRHCLVLDPDLAAARYLLGMVFEQRAAWTEAASEYRRALRSLEEGRARVTPFYLNNSRLQVACARAIERMERIGPPPSR